MTSSLLTRNKTQLGRTINHKVFWLVFHLLFGFLYLYSNNTLCVCFFMSFVNVFEEHNGWWIQKKGFIFLCCLAVFLSLFVNCTVIVIPHLKTLIND